MADTHNEAEVKTDYDALTLSDSTKRVGHKIQLEAQESYVREGDKVGIY